MKNDGSQSRTVISERRNIYVSELPEENGKSIHCEEVIAGSERPVATKLKEQSTPPLSSLSTVVVPIDQWKWKDIPAVNHVDKGSLLLSVSKTMTRILRHRGLHRGADGGDGRVMSGLNLHTGSDTKRFQYGLNPDGFTHCMHAIQGHS